MSAASAKRVAEVLDEQSDLTNPVRTPLWTVRDGSVKFDHVSFCLSKKDGEKALEDIDLDIKSGADHRHHRRHRLGEVQPCAADLPRLYDVTGGQRDASAASMCADTTSTTLRNNVAMVLQKNVLFSGTIAENLRWGNPDATDAEIERRLQASACADEFIERFPDKYETHIEQGGNNVSGGQKQRLCIARALLKKPKHPDPGRLHLRRRYRDGRTDPPGVCAKRSPDTTKFIIAQRISSVQDADQHPRAGQRAGSAALTPRPTC